MMHKSSSPDGGLAGMVGRGQIRLQTNKETPQTPRPRHASVGTKEPNSGHMQGDLNNVNKDNTSPALAGSSLTCDDEKLCLVTLFVDLCYLPTKRHENVVLAALGPWGASVS